MKANSRKMKIVSLTKKILVKALFKGLQVLNQKTFVADANFLLILFSY